MFNSSSITFETIESSHELTQAFMIYLKGDRGCREKTIEAYTSDLVHFTTFFKGVNLINISEEQIRKYKHILVTKKLAPRTVNRKISCINSFYEFLCRVKVISINPARYISKLRVPKSVPIILSEKQAETLLNGILITGKYGFRDYAIFSTFLFTGVRVSELTNLKLTDIDFDASTILVKDGKGGKDRLIPMIPRLSQALLLYLNNTKNHMFTKKYKYKCNRDYFDIHGSEYVFLSQKGDKFTPKGIEYLFKSYLTKFSIHKSGLTLHALRRSCLTFLYNTKKVDLYKLKELSGHSRIETLEHYLAVDRVKMAEAVLQHPLANQGIDFNLVDLVRGA